jgi:hypothetical protein
MERKEIGELLWLWLCLSLLPCVEYIVKRRPGVEEVLKKVEINSNLFFTLSVGRPKSRQQQKRNPHWKNKKKKRPDVSLISLSNEIVYKVMGSNKTRIYMQSPFLRTCYKKIIMYTIRIYAAVLHTYTRINPEPLLRIINLPIFSS